MARDRDTAFFGHPIGLRTLFFVEMWERFSYYGARALLVIFMVTPIAAGGRGMTETGAGLVLALYLSSAYLLSLPGGWIADRFLGQHRAITVGGIGIAMGNALLAVPNDALFFPGLMIIALGTGMLKPNASSVVGQLYGEKDPRRDSGYTIYYMGINVGALIAPLVCGFLAQSATFRDFLHDRGFDPGLCWHVAFGASALCMIIGVAQFLVTQRALGNAGKHPHIPSDAGRAARDRTVLTVIMAALAAAVVLIVVGSLTDAISISADVITNVFGVGLAIASVVLFFGLYRAARDAEEKKRIIAMIPLFLGSIAFFAVFEQASSTLSLFAEKLTTRELLGIATPASYYQSANSVFILMLGPVFAWMWVQLARKKLEPSSVVKFAIAMVLVAVSFVVMLPSLPAVNRGESVSGGYLIALYFFYTCAELCLSPVGLSSMSRLAPARLAGMVMGTWFLGTAVGNYLAGRATAFSEHRGYGFLFYFLIISALAVAAALYLVAPMIRRMMERGAPAATPAASEHPAA